MAQRAKATDYPILQLMSVTQERRLLRVSNFPLRKFTRKEVSRAKIPLEETSQYGATIWKYLLRVGFHL